MLTKIIVLVIFVVTYFFIIRHYEKKQIVVWVAVAILLLTGMLGITNALGAIDWNVILLYFGMLLVSEVFLYSKMPDFLAVYFASKTSSTMVAMLIVCALASALSILLENVAVVLLVAPIALSIAKKCKINPVPLFIGIAISSNLQGTATLIGDPPSMLLGSYLSMNFNEFFLIDGKPGMFFAVQLGAIVSLIVLYFAFKRYSGKMPKIEKEKYISIVPALFVIALVAALIVSSFLGDLIPLNAGAWCVIFGILCYAWYVSHTKDTKVVKYVKKLDWQTGLFLIGVFILVASLVSSGIVNDVAGIMGTLSGNSILLAFIIIVTFSVLLSAFIDNIPYLVIMLPVAQSLTDQLGANPYLFFCGLLLGASIGGNVTPIGASANIVSMGIMKREGYKTTFGGFVKIGLPFTIASVVASSAFIWIFFS